MRETGRVRVGLGNRHTPEEHMLKTILIIVVIVIVVLFLLGRLRGRK